MFTAATTSSILSVPVAAEPVVKEYDVYVLAIAEAPSLWQPLPALHAQLQGLASEIGGANPNLRFRLHWITRLGYGRDAAYVPYVNETTASDVAAPWAFWYPGKLAPGAGASTLYSAEMLSGRVRTEAGVLHDYDAQANRHPHAIADRFNHCLPRTSRTTCRRPGPGAPMARWTCRSPSATSSSAIRATPMR